MTVTAPLQRLDRLTVDLSLVESNVTVLQSNVASIEANVSTLVSYHPSANVLLTAPGGNVYVVSVDDGGNLITSLQA